MPATTDKQPAPVTMYEVKNLIFELLMDKLMESPAFCGIADKYNGDSLVLTTVAQNGTKRSFKVTVEETDEPSPVQLPVKQTQDASGGCCSSQPTCNSQAHEGGSQEQAAAQDDANQQPQCGDAGECESQDA